MARVASASNSAIGSVRRIPSGVTYRRSDPMMVYMEANKIFPSLRTNTNSPTSRTGATDEGGAVAALLLESTETEAEGAVCCITVMGTGCWMMITWGCCCCGGE